MTFGNWDEDIHFNPKQVTKIASALEIKESDITLDVNTESALISGSSDDPYKVTLNECTCGSFNDKKPCKHMYCLAMKLGLFDGPPAKNTDAEKAFKKEIPNEIDRYRKLYCEGAISAAKFSAIAKALESKK